MIFGLSYFRIGAYVVIAAIMGYLIYQYRTGQEAKKQVALLTAELDAEVNCLVGSKCALRITDEANKAAKATIEAQEEAARQNKEAKERAEAQANEYADQIAKAVKQHNADLLKIMSHQNTPSCQKWREEIDPCATH